MILHIVFKYSGNFDILKQIVLCQILEFDNQFKSVSVSSINGFVEVALVKCNVTMCLVVPISISVNLFDLP